MCDLQPQQISVLNAMYPMHLMKGAGRRPEWFLLLQLTSSKFQRKLVVNSSGNEGVKDIQQDLIAGMRFQLSSGNYCRAASAWMTVRLSHGYSIAEMWVTDHQWITQL